MDGSNYYTDLNPDAKPFDFLPTPPASPEHKAMRRHSVGSAMPPPGPGQLRRQTKKDLAAAARRRRHSVDALDFAGVIITDVPGFLRHIRLHKYTDIFEASHVTLEQLLRMDDNGLDRVGVHAQGARTRLLKAIERYNEYVAQQWAQPPAQPLPPSPLQAFQRRVAAERRNSAPPAVHPWALTPPARESSLLAMLNNVNEEYPLTDDDDNESLDGKVEEVAEKLLSILDVDDDPTPLSNLFSARNPANLWGSKAYRPQSRPEPSRAGRAFDIWGVPVSNMSGMPVRAL